MDLEDDLFQKGVWTNLAEFALKQVKSAYKICPTISALHGVFCFERWQWPAAGAWGVKGNICVAADILSDLLPKSVAGEAKKDKAETLLLKLPVGDLCGSVSSSMCSAMSNMAETLAKMGIEIYIYLHCIDANERLSSGKYKRISFLGTGSVLLCVTLPMEIGYLLLNDFSIINLLRYRKFTK